MPPLHPETLHVGLTLWRDDVAWMIEDLDLFQGEVTLSRPRVGRPPVRRTLPLAELEDRGYTRTPPT